MFRSPGAKVMIFVCFFFFFSSRRRHTRSSTVSWARNVYKRQGWYTEIMAPYLRDHGKYYAAHFSPNASASYMPPNLRNFEEKITADPDLYGKITVRHLNPPNEVAIAPAESADMALTFRNVHNWIMAGQEHEYFATFYKALKPGGVLGVVEHRAKPCPLYPSPSPRDRTRSRMPSSA